MLTIENVEVHGWAPAIRGMRNPKNSWDLSDSGMEYENIRCPGHFVVGPKDFELMMNLRNAGTDHRKFMRFIAVYLDINAPLYWWKEFETYRIGVYPNPSEIEMNSCSTMHKIHDKEFTRDDFSREHLFAYNPDKPTLFGAIEFKSSASKITHLTAVDLLDIKIDALNQYRELFLQTGDKDYWWQMIQLLPSSYNQKRTLMVNYEVLANIYRSRHNHKLDEWRTLCEWTKTLQCHELITSIKGATL